MYRLAAGDGSIEPLPTARTLEYHRWNPALMAQCMPGNAEWRNVCRGNADDICSFTK